MQGGALIEIESTRFHLPEDLDQQWELEDACRRHRPLRVSRDLLAGRQVHRTRAATPPAWSTTASSARSTCARVPIRFTWTVMFVPSYTYHSSDGARRS